MNASANKPRYLLRPRIYIGDAIKIGPGRVELLRQVNATRSIAAAARSLGLPYKRAWLLIDSLNRGFGRPVVETAAGGKGGGGASLTPLGQRIIEHYDALEARLNTCADEQLQALCDLASGHNIL